MLRRFLGSSTVLEVAAMLPQEMVCVDFVGVVVVLYFITARHDAKTRMKTRQL